MTRGDLTRINVRLSSFRTIFSQHPSITLALVCEWQGFSAVNINLFEEAEMITPRFRLAYLVVLMGLAIIALRLLANPSLSSHAAPPLARPGPTS
jgi:hypothetical protein